MREALTWLSRFFVKPEIAEHERRTGQNFLKAGQALDDLPSLWKESDGFWNWIEAKAPPRKAAKRRSTAAQTFGATMDDGAIVLGTIELGTKTVTVNSEARAARGRAMLEPVLAGLARAPLVERQSIEQMMASSREHSEQDIVRLPPDEERSIVHQALTDHFRKTLDEPIPALGGQQFLGLFSGISRRRVPLRPKAEARSLVQSVSCFVRSSRPEL